MSICRNDASEESDELLLLVVPPLVTYLRW
jgi:hypothetical protein